MAIKADNKEPLKTETQINEPHDHNESWYECEDGRAPEPARCVGGPVRRCLQLGDDDSDAECGDRADGSDQGAELSSKEGATCAVCDTGLTPGGAISFCEVCDFMVCLACPSPSECPAGHALQPLYTVEPGHSCDLCGRRYGDGDAFISCITCDYDVCLVCRGATRRPVD